MPTSYSNPGGSGYRYPIQIPTTNASLGGGGTNPNVLVDGSFGHAFWWNPQSAAGLYVKIDLGAARVIDEIKWYQSTTNTHGTWQWFGSNDDSSYTAIGATFTLGGATTQTLATLSGNTTAYRYYKMVGSAGTTSDNPWLTGIEFKIGPPATVDYWNPFGYGDRRTSNVVTLTQSTAIMGSNGDVIRSRFNAAADLTRLVNGAVDGGTAQQEFEQTGSIDRATAWLKFDFGSGNTVVVDQLIIHGDAFSSNLTCKLQGSNDNSTWTDIGGSAVWICNTHFTAPNGNTTAYRYYRMYVVSGVPNTNPFLYEIYFRVSVPVTGLTGTFSAAADPRLAMYPANYFMAAADPLASFVGVVVGLFGAFAATADPLARFTQGVVILTAEPLARFTGRDNAYTAMGFGATAYPQLHVEGVVPRGFTVIADPLLGWFVRVSEPGSCASQPGADASGVPTNYVF